MKELNKYDPFDKHIIDLVDSGKLKIDCAIIKPKARDCRYYIDANCWYWKAPCQGLPCNVYVRRKQ